MGLYEWLLQLPRWIQYGVSLLLLASSTFMFVYGWVWPWGWILGLILLWISCFGRRPSNADDEPEI